MTVQQWLSNVYYDKFGIMILNKECEDCPIQTVADIRGWGELLNEFANVNEVNNFQDEVGEFIVEAIREKIERQRVKQTTNIFNPQKHIFQTMSGRYGLESIDEHDQVDGYFDTYEQAELACLKKIIEILKKQY